jgi:hypothetical protein
MKPPMQVREVALEVLGVYLPRDGINPSSGASF